MYIKPNLQTLKTVLQDTQPSIRAHTVIAAPPLKHDVTE